MYNPIFVAYTQLSKYIYSLEIVKPAGIYSSEELAITRAVFDADGVTLDLRIGRSDVQTFSQKSSFGQLYTISADTIVIAGRMPETPLTIDEECLLLPSVVTYRNKAVEDLEVRVDVKSPLKAEVIGDNLLLSIVEDTGITIDSGEISGIYSINGIYPDDNGNISIVSKTPEVAVNVIV